MLGNLESTGMVPRPGREKARLGSVRNFVEPEDISPLRLRPSPVDTAAAGTQYEDTEDGEGDLDIPVSEDSYQVEGQGDVEVRLGAETSGQHRYQISRGRDGEVNIEVAVGEADTQPGTDTDIVIDNTDYNYTLIISGENIQVTLHITSSYHLIIPCQVVHHDTNRNLTYRHGLDQRQISGVGVQGDLRGTATSFKQPEAQARVQEQVAYFLHIYNLYIYCVSEGDHAYLRDTHALGQVSPHHSRPLQ